MDDEDWFDTAAAAAKSGRSDRHIRRLCKSGKLLHRRDGKGYLIDPASLEQLMSEIASAEDTMSDEGQSENESSPVADSDREADADMQASSADMDQLSSDMPADIAALARQLRTSIQAVRTSHDEMSDVADQLLRHLRFEYRRNRDIEERLQEMVVGLNMKPKMRPWQSKQCRKSKAILPWILFGVSAVMALMLWF